MTDQKLCVNGCNRPRARRYKVCQRCRHGPPVVCSCGNLKRPESIQCCKCHRSNNRGEKHNAWKGGRIVDKDGYIRVYRPEDSRANCGRYMKEHTIVMEEFLGRRLHKNETVHHKNGIRSDNRIENLELWIQPHPYGQRVSDLLLWAKEIIKTYEKQVG